MIYVLDQALFHKARPLFTGLSGWNLIIDAVIEGTSPGKVFVDDLNNPRSVFLSSAEGYYLAGNAHNVAFNTALHELITGGIFAGETVRAGDDELDLRFLQESGWGDKLMDIIPERQPLPWRRRYYTCANLKLDWSVVLPEGYAVHRIDTDLVGRMNIRNTDDPLNQYALDEMNGCWGGIDAFLERGLGFGTLCGERPVCWCIADCASGKLVEIGISTHPEFRRRGLAAITTAAMVEYCLAHGFTTIGWHCNSSNTGSWKTAEKVGFVQDREYLGHVVMFDPIEHLAVTGLHHVYQKRFRQAVESYEQVFATGGDHPHTYYHMAARACAALGDKRSALSYLSIAIDRGEDRLEHTLSCTEFSILHGSPEWDAVLARIQEATNHTS